MNFVQTTFLAAVAAIAIPVIVHLMFRSQARRVNLGTLRFLRQVLERNAQRQRILRWLLLALRMAAACLLAVLFARPYFLQAGPGGDKKLLLVLIDNSASMELKGDHGRLIDQAIAEAKRIISEQGPRTRVEVALFDHAVRPLGEAGSFNRDPRGSASIKGERDLPDALPRGSRINDDAATTRDTASKLLTDLPLPKPSHRATNYGVALSWARDLSLRAGQGEQELHLFTDLQRSGLDWTEVDPLPEQVRVHLHDLGRAVVNNIAVTEARPIRAVIRPGESATVQATLFNGGAFPIEELPVVLKLESAKGKLSQREKVKLEPASTAVVKFELPAMDAGLWSGTVSVEADDDLKFDNARHLAIFAAPPYRVLLLDGEPHVSPLLSETYFLSTALRLAGPNESDADSPFETVTSPLAVDDSLPNLKDVDVVVLANVGTMQAADAKRLAEYVENGGGLIVFCGEKVLAKGYQTLADVGLTPGEIIGPAHATDLPFRIDSWDEKSSLLRPFNDPQHGDLRRLAFRGYTKFNVAVTLRETKAGLRQTPNAQSRSDAPLTSTSNVPTALVSRSETATLMTLAAFRNGDPALIELQRGKGTALWFTSTCDRAWGEWPSTRLFVPLVHQMVGQPLGLNDGGPVRVALIDSTSDLPAETSPGIIDRQRHWQVINSSPRESETDRCSAEDFASRFQIALQTDDGTAVSNVAAALSNVELRSDEQWHWAAFALVGLLLVETFVANRTVS